MTELPTVDIIVSTYNEERYVERCLQHALGQDYPSELTRVIVVDGGSSDGTVPIVRRLGDADPRLILVADGKYRTLPDAMNLGLTYGSGIFVAKVDAHGYPAHDFVRRAVEAFGRCEPDVACVGGRPEQIGETAWGEAVALARTSRFGVGGSVYAGSSTHEFVDTVQCGVYRRSALAKVGAFDPSMAYGEDDELNWRLREAGYRILLDTSIRFRYVARPSLGALYRQYRNYGRAKPRVIAEHPSFVRPWHFAPAAAVTVGGVCSIAAAAGSRVARVALVAGSALYAAGATAAAVRAAGSRGPAAVMRVGACFGAIHAGYGVGMFEGLVALVKTRVLRTVGGRKNGVL